MNLLDQLFGRRAPRTGVVFPSPAQTVGTLGLARLNQRITAWTNRVAARKSPIQISWPRGINAGMFRRQ